MEKSFLIKLGIDEAYLNKNIEKSFKKISDEEIMINLNYNGNASALKKTLNSVSKNNDVKVDIEYQIATKELENESKKMQNLLHIRQYGIDTDEATDQIIKLKNELVELSNIKGISQKTINSKVKEIFATANTLNNYGGNIDLNKLGIDIGKQLQEKGFLNKYIEGLFTQNIKKINVKDFDFTRYISQKDKSLPKYEPSLLFKDLGREINRTQKNIEILSSWIKDLPVNDILGRMGYNSESIDEILERLEIIKKAETELNNIIDTPIKNDNEKQLQNTADTVERISKQASNIKDVVSTLNNLNMKNLQITANDKMYSLDNYPKLETISALDDYINDIRQGKNSEFNITGLYSKFSQYFKDIKITEEEFSNIILEVVNDRRAAYTNIEKMFTKLGYSGFDDKKFKLYSDVLKSDLIDNEGNIVATVKTEQAYKELSKIIEQTREQQDLFGTQTFGNTISKLDEIKNAIIEIEKLKNNLINSKGDVITSSKIFSQIKEQIEQIEDLYNNNIELNNFKSMSNILDQNFIVNLNETLKQFGTTFDIIERLEKIIPNFRLFQNSVSNSQSVIEKKDEQQSPEKKLNNEQLQQIKVDSVNNNLSIIAQKLDIIINNISQILGYLNNDNILKHPSKLNNNIPSELTKSTSEEYKKEEALWLKLSNQIQHGIIRNKNNEDDEIAFVISDNNKRVSEIVRGTDEQAPDINNYTKEAKWHIHHHGFDNDFDMLSPTADDFYTWLSFTKNVAKKKGSAKGFQIINGNEVLKITLPEGNNTTKINKNGGYIDNFAMNQADMIRAVTALYTSGRMNANLGQDIIRSMIKKNIETYENKTGNTGKLNVYRNIDGKYEDITENRLVQIDEYTEQIINKMAKYASKYTTGDYLIYGEDFINNDIYRNALNQDEKKWMKNFFKNRSSFALTKPYEGVLYNTGDRELNLTDEEDNEAWQKLLLSLSEYFAKKKDNKNNNSVKKDIMNLISQITKSDYDYSEALKNSTDSFDFLSRLGYASVTYGNNILFDASQMGQSSVLKHPKKVQQIEGQDKEIHKAREEVNKLLSEGNLDDKSNERLEFILKTLERLKNVGTNTFQTLQKEIQEFIAKADTAAKNAQNITDIMSNSNFKNIPQSIKNGDVSKITDYLQNSTNKEADAIRKRLVALNDQGKAFTPEYLQQLEVAENKIKEINSLLEQHQQDNFIGDEKGLQKVIKLLSEVQETTSGLNLKTNTIVPTGEVDKLIGKLKGTNFERLQLPFNQKKQMTDMINYLEEIRSGGTEAAEALEKVFGIKINAKDLSKIDANTYKKIAESVTGMVAATKGVDEGFFSRFGARLKSVNMQFVTMMFSFYDWIRYARQAFSVVQQFDKALTTISFTMNTTTKQLNGLAQQSIDMAKELGTTTNQVLSVAQIYANMQSTSEEIMERAKPTVMLSTASGLDTSTVSDYLQAVENEFEMSASDAEHIADVYESISANIAMDFGKGIGVIAEGTQVSGQLAHEAGMSFEQFAAIIAKTAETTRQSGSVIGNAWKTIISRLTKSGSMSEEVDPETLSKSAESLGAIGIQIYDNMGNFRNLETILTELSSKWGSLSDAQQANIAYNVAGIRNRNQFAVALKSYASAAELAAKTTEDVGIAEKNADKYADSLAGKVGTLKSTAQGLIFNIFDSNTIKDGIGMLQGLLNGLDLLREKIGALPTLSIGLSGIMTARNFGFVGTGSMLNRIMNNGLFNGGITNGSIFGKQISGASPEITNLIHAYNNEIDITEDMMKKAALATGRTTEELKKSLMAMDKGKASAQGLANGLEATKAQMVATRFATFALNAAIMAGVAVVTTIIYKYATAEQEMAKISAKAHDEIQKNENAIKDYKSKLEEAQKTLADSNASYEDQYEARKNVYQVQKDMIDAYGSESPLIDTVTGKIKNEAEAWRLLAQNEYDAQKRKMDYGKGGIGQWFNNGIKKNKTWSILANRFEYSENPDGTQTSLGNPFSGYDLSLESDRQKALIEQWVANFKNVTPEIQAIMDSLKFDNTGTYDAFTLKNKLNELKTALETSGVEISDAFEKSIETKLGLIESDIENYGDFYLDTAKNTISNDDELNLVYNNLENISKEYEDAIGRADTSAAEELAEKYRVALNDALARTNVDAGVKELFNNVDRALTDNANKITKQKSFLDDLIKQESNGWKISAKNTSADFVKNNIEPYFNLWEITHNSFLPDLKGDKAISAIRDQIISKLNDVYNLDINKEIGNKEYGILTKAIDDLLWGSNGTYDYKDINNRLSQILQQSTQLYAKAQAKALNSKNDPLAKKLVDTFNNEIFSADQNGNKEFKLYAEDFIGMEGQSVDDIISRYGEDAGEAYRQLINAANYYHLSIEETIDLLKQESGLTSRIGEDAKNKFTRRDYKYGNIINQDVLDWLDTLSDEDLQLLLDCDFDNTASLENLKSELYRLQQEAKKNPIELSYAEFNTKLQNAGNIGNLYKEITEGYKSNKDFNPTLESIEGLRDVFQSFGIENEFKSFEEDLLNIGASADTASTKLKNTEQVFDDIADRIASQTLKETPFSLENVDVVTSQLKDKGVVEKNAGSLRNLAQAMSDANVKFEDFTTIDSEVISGILGIGNANLDTNSKFKILEGATLETQMAFFNLWMQMNNLSSTDLSGWSNSQLQALINMAETAGVTTAAIAGLKAVVESGEVDSSKTSNQGDYYKARYQEDQRKKALEGKTVAELLGDTFKKVQDQYKYTAPKDYTAATNGATDATKEEVDVLAELNSELDEIQDTYSKLADTVEYYNENGSITVDQFQEISNMGLQFLSYLSDENGQLKLNEQAFEDLARAKVAEMQVQLARQALDAINGLKSEADAAEYLAFANEHLRDATLSANEQLLQQAYIAAKLKGGLIGQAAEEIMKSYQNQKMLAEKIDYSTLRNKEQEKEQEKEEEKEYGISKDLQSQINHFKGELDIQNGLDDIESGEITSKIFEKVYDWIEKALEKLERDVKKWEDSIDDFFTWVNKRLAIEKTQAATQIEIDKTYQAVIDYQKYLDKIPLEQSYKDKIMGKGWGIQKVSVMSVGTKDFVDYNSAAAEWEERDKLISEFQEYLKIVGTFVLFYTGKNKII